jgi:AraC-like DNA-binding protein
MKTNNGKNDNFLYYLTYSKEDEKLGMVCTTAGEIYTPPNTAYPPNKDVHPLAFRDVAVGRTLPEFQLVYISEGEGTFSADGTTYQVEPGSVLLILPGMKHFYMPRYETGWREHWVGFTGGFFSRMVGEGILSKERVFFKVGLNNYVLSLFTGIFDEVRLQKPLYQVKVCSLVFSLLAEILSHERRKGCLNHLQEIMEKAKYLMEENIDKEIDITSIARIIGVSVSQLNNIFKTYTSMTSYQYYILTKINKARRLLEQEGVSVKEVAFNLGFSDQYYFSRLFKQKTGVPPSEWNKSVYK